jgi:hypothetical protein
MDLSTIRPVTLPALKFAQFASSHMGAVVGKLDAMSAVLTAGDTLT